MSKKRLDSWKAIALFLDRSLRTVQRWHVCNGLPVHHFGGQKGSVFAYEEEIENWLANLTKVPSATQQGADAMLESGRRRSQELTATANSMWEARSERNIQSIAEFYRSAIADDSSNSAAYAGLANAMVFCALNELMDGALAYPCATEALRQIQRLGSESLDTKCPAAWIDLLFHRNWREARAGFEESLNRRPSSFALAGLAAIDIAEGYILRAQSRAWEASRFSPLASSLSGFLCWVVYLNGQYKQVLDLTAQIRSGGGDAGILTAVEALALIQTSAPSLHVDRIEKVTSNFPLNHTLQGILGYAYGASGRTSQARKIYEHLAHCSTMNNRSNGYGLAMISLGLGNRDEAIDWLEVAYREGTLWSLGFRSDPMLVALRGAPRFEQLVSKIGSSADYSRHPVIHSLIDQSMLDSVLALGGPKAPIIGLSSPATI